MAKPILDTTSISENELRAKLKGANPVKVRVKLGDDVLATIALGHTRRRWSTFLEALSKLGAWSRLECLEKSGDVVAIIDNDGEAGDLEDLATPSQRADERDILKVERILKIQNEGILRAQREVLAMRDRDTAMVMQSVSSVVKELTGALRTMGELHAAQMESAVEAATSAAAAQQKDWVEQATELAAAAPQLAPVIQLLFGALGIGKALPKGANGAPNGAKPAPPKVTPQG